MRGIAALAIVGALGVVLLTVPICAQMVPANNARPSSAATDSTAIGPIQIAALIVG